jgi:hypothetical protein
MTLTEIKAAVESGKRVYQHHPGYEVKKDPLGGGRFQWLTGTCFASNNSPHEP